MGLAPSVVRKNDDCSCNTLLDYNIFLNDCAAFELNEKFIESKIDELDEIEAPRRRTDGESSTVRTFDRFQIRSLTPPQAAGNALAVSVQNNAIY